MDTTTARIPRTLEPLVVEDLGLVRTRIRGSQHRIVRSDHVGSWRSCSGCDDVVFWAGLGLAARARSQGWSRIEALDALSSGAVAVKSLAQDGERMRRASAGVPTRPDTVARALVFRRVLDAAWADGSLSQHPDIAVEVLRWAITFAGDPGDRVHDGGFLPFDRIARSVVAGSSPGGITDAQVAAGWAGLGHPADQHLRPAVRVERLWNEIVAACATEVRAADKLDSVMGSCSDRLGMQTHDGLLPAGSADVGAPTDLPADGPSELVLAAAERVRGRRGFRSTTSGQRRLAVAVEEVVAEVVERHGVAAASVAGRPEVLELALEVLAEVDRQGS